MDFLLGLLTLPLYVLVLWPLVAASRRVLGVRIGAVRALCAAAFGWLVAGGIGQAFPVSLLHNGGAALGLLIPLAGSAFLATLIFLFVAELALPHGAGLGRLRGRLSRTRRYAQISRIAVKHGLGRHLTGRREPGLAPGRHAKLARSLRRALEEGGVTFVKLGQLLSTRADLLPPVFVDELGRLQDQVAPARAEAVRALLAAELGGSPDDVFAEFDPEPLAAASVAQVYRAKLRSGEDVVVKVQRPGVRSRPSATSASSGASPRRWRTARTGRARSVSPSWPTGSPRRWPKNSTSPSKPATSPPSPPRAPRTSLCRRSTRDSRPIACWSCPAWTASR